MMDYLATEWSGLLKTIIGAGIGSALIQGLLAIYRDGRQKEAQATFMAMRVAVILEAYTAACHDLIAYNEMAYAQPEEQYPSWKAILPELGDFPSDTEGWRAIPTGLAARCLGFQNKLRGSQVRINETIYTNTGALGATVEAEAVERGLEAWRLAAALRRKHGLSKADTVYGFVQELERIERRAADYRKARLKGSA